jgi:hypothetical protein
MGIISKFIQDYQMEYSIKTFLLVWRSSRSGKLGGIIDRLD